MEPSALGQIEGIAAGGGRYRGRALVVHCADDLAGLRHGDVVVAAIPRREYGHALRQAGALVAGGGILSRLATVARELGIPAVVTEPDALGRIATGDALLLDGDRGLVEFVPGS